jgi:hypothetical protein
MTCAEAYGVQVHHLHFPLLAVKRQVLVEEPSGGVLFIISERKIR